MQDIQTTTLEKTTAWLYLWTWLEMLSSRYPKKLPLKTANLTENQPKLKLNMYDKGGKTKKGNTINGVQYDPYGFPVTDTTGTASYEKMAEYLLGTRGGTRERMEDLMYDIASTESGATYDPAIKQIGGGPGRGIFQYEGPGGSNRAKDALTRAVAYYNSSKTEKMPKWLSSYIKESNGVYDFSKLTIPQQKALFLADYSQAKNIPFGDYMKGDISTEDMWAKYHKVSGADRPHFRKLKEVGDRKKEARTMTSEKFREIVTGKVYALMKASYRKYNNGGPVNPKKKQKVYTDKVYTKKH